MKTCSLSPKRPKFLEDGERSILKRVCNILLFLLVVGFVFRTSTASAVQNYSHKKSRANRTFSQAELEKLTLALVDRLPSDMEREFVQSRGATGAYDFATHLIRTREFFDRLSLYWQTHLTQSPAWLWESGGELRWHKHFLASAEKRIKPIYFFHPKQTGNRDRDCSGVWTILEEENPQLCTCDESADVLPHWDSSASMSVCPVAKQEDNCGPSLQKCLPIDARFQAQVRDLGIDRVSAGGRAISRMLNDLKLAQSRSIALAIMTQRKWGQISQPIGTLLSRSSIELLNKWGSVDVTSHAAAITNLLRTTEIAAQTKPFFLPPIVTLRSRSTRQMTESPAEELLPTAHIEGSIFLRPLRQSKLGADVWAWNAHLILNCQVPHVSPQLFQLPLPNAESARDGFYFCSSCHISLDKFSAEIRNQSKSHVKFKAMNALDSHGQRRCAVEHALHFLLGYRTANANQSELIKAGEVYFDKNGELLGNTIRDLALRIAGRGETE